MHRGGWVSDEETAQRERSPGRGAAAAPACACGIRAQCGCEHVIVAVRIDEKKGLLAADGNRRKHGVSWVRVGLCGRSLHAGEDLVPDRIAPFADCAVADEELLLRSVDHVSSNRVGDEAAAGIRRSGAVVHERGIAIHLDATPGSGLRHGPELAGIAAEFRRRHVDGEVRQRTPEVAQRHTAGTAALVTNIHRTVDHDVVGRGAQTCDLRVIPDLEVEWLSA